MVAGLTAQIAGPYAVFQNQYPVPIEATNDRTS